jgi:hypothetical protein
VAYDWYWSTPAGTTTTYTLLAVHDRVCGGAVSGEGVVTVESDEQEFQPIPTMSVYGIILTLLGFFYGWWVIVYADHPRQVSSEPVLLEWQVAHSVLPFGTGKTKTQ